MPARDREAVSGSAIAAPTNVLLFASSFDPDGDEACVDLLTAATPEPINALYITLTHPADDRLDMWDQHAPTQPSKTGVITVGNKTGLGGAVTATPPAPTIRHVSNVADLTEIGIQFTEFLSEWQDDSHQIVVCFHSLTTLLQYVDLKRAFRFLHVFTGHVRSADAIAHYHMDRSAHDERELNTLKSIFDTMIDVTDGQQIVQTR